jgi:hypothetical protein
MNPVEFIDSGITYEATTGTFSYATVDVSDLFVFAENVSYTFTLNPLSSFSSAGRLRITFPDEF